jgi:hypothetical protein
MTDWKIYLVVVLTGLCLWRSEARPLRVVAVLVNVALVLQYGVFLSNVGRNTFDHVERHEPSADTFREGVFVEAKAADAFARKQLLAVYVVVICLGGLAIWPAVARRGGKPDTASKRLKDSSAAPAQFK